MIVTQTVTAVRLNEWLGTHATLCALGQALLKCCKELIEAWSKPANTDTTLLLPRVGLDTRAIGIVLCVSEDESTKFSDKSIDCHVFNPRCLTLELSGCRR